MDQSSLPDRVIQAFGGLSKTADAISAPVSTVDSWRSSGKIPHWRVSSIRIAASRLSVALPDDFPKEEASAA